MPGSPCPAERQTEGGTTLASHPRRGIKPLFHRNAILPVVRWLVVRSVNFTIKLFIEDYMKLDPIQSLVMDRLWYAFKWAGVDVPYPIREVRMRNASACEREHLADTIQVVPFAAGETLCREGEPGDSFYIIRSGQVAVSLAGADGQPVPVAHLEAGAFFGEMSLLTGEARSATATAGTDVEVWCVSKGDLAGLLQENADLAGKLAAVLERRAAERHAKMATSAKGPAPLTHSTLVARIRRFFDLH